MVDIPDAALQAVQAKVAGVVGLRWEGSCTVFSYRERVMLATMEDGSEFQVARYWQNKTTATKYDALLASDAVEWRTLADVVAFHVARR